MSKKNQKKMVKSNSMEEMLSNFASQQKEVVEKVAKEKKITMEVKVKLNEITELEKELLALKASLKAVDLEEISTESPVKRLKAEVYNLEIRNIHLKAHKGRLEDKLDSLQRSYDEASKILERAHLEALDREEMNYMALQIENKKNDLMSARNYVKEMQKIGWTFLPPKVADECSKTQIELDYVYKTVKSIRDETEEAMVILHKTVGSLKNAQNQYVEIQEYNTKTEHEIDMIVEEINDILSTMNIKEGQAKELEDVVHNMKTKIELAREAQIELGKQTELEREERIQENNRRREEMRIRNKEVDELKEKYAMLTEEAKAEEEKLSEIQKELREQNAMSKNVEKQNYTTAELKIEIEEVKKECAILITETYIEKQQKQVYLNIIEDMLGNLKILCRCRDSNTNFLKTNDTFVQLKSSTDAAQFKFDFVLDVNSTTQDVFEKVEHFYGQLMDGYNCYIVAIGEKDSGKTYNILGNNNDGLLFLGLNKIKEMIKINKKNQMTTRMFACAVEIYDNRIYDLLHNAASDKFEVRKDYFGMTLINHAKYEECFTDDEARVCFQKAIKNRPAAFGALNTKDTNFVSILTVQTYNKFQHRYCKGKITHVKLASISKNKETMEELAAYARGQPINYNRSPLLKLLRDGFGGNAKTCVLGCINSAEANAKDTMATMKLVSSLKSVTNEIARNMDSEEAFKLKNNIERLLRGDKTEYL